MPRKLSAEYVKETIEKSGYTVMGSYVNSLTPLFLSCPQNHQFNVTFNNFTSRNSRCPYCKADNTAKRCKIPYDEILKIAKSKDIIILTTQEEYEKNHKKKLVLQAKCSCGRPRKLVYTTLKSTTRCIKCNNSGQKIRVKFSKIIEAASKLGLEIKEQPYKSNQDKLTAKCPIHGELKIMFNSLQQGHGCWECSKDKNRKLNILRRVPIETVKEKISLMGGTLLSEKYINNKQKLEVKCGNGHRFEARWDSLRGGHWCPQCLRLTSSQEQEIVNFIRSQIDTEIIQNDRKVLKGQELDIWLPEFNFGIEFDGLYWHSEKVKTDIKEKTKKKYLAIKEAGIKILAVFEDEWADPIKNEIIKSMILQRIGKSAKIHARKTDTIEVSKTTAKRFMEDNHLDGHTPFVRAIGLKDKNNELVMCMTFRVSKGRVKEIARMASKRGCTVIGGMSKLISTIKEPLMSYSDNRVGHGDAYRAVGFIEITESTDLSYWYTDFLTRIYRTKCQRKPELPGTEREQAASGVFSHLFGNNRPIYRIYDYGQRKWYKP